MYHFGPITDVTSTMRYDVHKTDTADVAVCQVRFSSGLVSTLSAYHVTPYRHFLAIFGTKAALYRDDRSYFEGTKLLRQDVGSGGHEPQIIQSLEGTSDEIGNLRAFYRAVTTGQMQYPSLFDGARALTAVFAAAESAKTGQRASVENFAFPSNCIEPILS
jgi:predicted dehydrogenase